jgi:hypothetical protein
MKLSSRGINKGQRPISRQCRCCESSLALTARPTSESRVEPEERDISESIEQELHESDAYPTTRSQDTVPAFLRFGPSVIAPTYT